MEDHGMLFNLYLLNQKGYNCVQQLKPMISYEKVSLFNQPLRSYINQDMKETAKIIIILIALYCCQAANVLNKVLVDDPAALCLDGTPAAYYVHQADKNKFVLSFEGGGWCGNRGGLSQTLESCFQRSKGALGSSSSYPSTISATEGILSDNQKNLFRNWTIVHLKYCDGTGHQGYKKDPIDYKATKIYFRGHNATMGQLNSIDKNFKLFSEATEIVVTGQSAGGLATFLWTNYIAKRAPKTAKVWSLPDSGIFLDQPSFKTKKNEYRQGFINFMSIANIEVDPPTEECVKANPNEKWKCLFGQYLHQYITVPLFPIQSLYDEWALPNILDISCGAAGSFANCTQAEIQYIEQYKKNTTTVMKNIGRNSENGGWGIACSNHVYSTSTRFYSVSFRVPGGSDNSAEFGVSQWMAGNAGSHQYVDSVSWPNNNPCSGVKQLVTE